MGFHLVVALSRDLGSESGQPSEKDIYHHLFLFFFPAARRQIEEREPRSRRPQFPAPFAFPSLSEFRGAGLPGSKLVKWEFELQKMYAQQAAARRTGPRNRARLVSPCTLAWLWLGNVLHLFFADGGLVAEIQAPNCQTCFFGSPSNVNRADRQVELVALAARPMDWRMGGLVSPNAHEQRPRPPPIEVATSEKTGSEICFHKG